MKRIAIRTTLGVALTAAVCSGAASAAQPQQVTGTPGAPNATTPISGVQIPAPDPKFGGVIYCE